MAEQALNTDDIVYDTAIGAGIGDQNMTYVAVYLLLQTIDGKHTFSIPKKPYSDTANVAGITDLKGTIDWTDHALEELEKVYEECSEANWDGYGAMPISRDTYSEARKLLRMMPSSLQRPDISAEPDGEITFE